MKTKHLLFSIAIGLTTGLLIFSGLNVKEGGLYKPRNSKEFTESYGIYGATEWKKQAFVDLEKGYADPKDVLKAKEQVKELRQQKGLSFSGLEWEEMGVEPYCQKADYTKLPYPDNAFDWVIMGVPQKPRVGLIKEIKRISNNHVYFFFNGNGGVHKVVEQGFFPRIYNENPEGYTIEGEWLKGERWSL